MARWRQTGWGRWAGRASTSRTGQERGAWGPQDTDKFATYHRDETNLDYADQRYDASTIGRFLTPDPYVSGKGSGDPINPQSWNRYAYVLDDPINLHDRTGLQAEGPGYDPYEALLELILSGLRLGQSEIHNEPPPLSDVPELLQNSTRWGREWAVEALGRINRNCGDRLRRVAAGSMMRSPDDDISIGRRLADVVQTALVVQTWDQDQMNATIPEFSDNQTLREWIVEHFGDWNDPNPANRWIGAAGGRVIIIAESGATSLNQQMATLVHELLHLAMPQVGHARIADALGLYDPAWARFGPEAAAVLASDAMTGWASDCVGEVR